MGKTRLLVGLQNRQNSDRNNWMSFSLACSHLENQHLNGWGTSTWQPLSPQDKGQERRPWTKNTRKQIHSVFKQKGLKQGQQTVNLNSSLTNQFHFSTPKFLNLFITVKRSQYLLNHDMGTPPLHIMDILYRNRNRSLFVLKFCGNGKHEITPVCWW